MLQIDREVIGRMNRELDHITETVADFILGAAETGASEADFNRVALAVFEFQYRSIQPYRSLCQRKGRTPETVEAWTDIPAVPADAFKHFVLFAGQPAEVERTFSSSGTTDPRYSSKAHFSAAGLNLMKTSVEANAARMLFPDGRRTRILILAPGPDLVPSMIMATGMSYMMALFGLPASHFCAGAQGLDTSAVLAELRECEAQSIPVTLMGSSFGFVHLFDSMESQGIRINLPENSRLMDAGGYKGRSREIERNDFVQWASAMLGLQPERVVNLLGLTELASQIYDCTLANDFRNGFEEGPAAFVRMKEPPPWMRTQVLDPTKLAGGDFERVTGANRHGLLRHLDLANVERPMVVQTDDVGFLRSVTAGHWGREGFEIIHRVKGSEPRGCSLSIEEFASAASSASHGGT